MKAVALVSTGIDSPVAAYLMKKKGIDITLLHLQTVPDKIWMEKIAKILGNELVIKEYAGYLEKVIKTNRKNTCILCKRGMLRHGEIFAEEIGAKAIITGDNLGQVASQTLDNMATIDASVSLPVFRPLLCMDKNEITKIAKKIGTYDISKRSNEPCPFVPKKPATTSAIPAIEHQESLL